MSLFSKILTTPKTLLGAQSFNDRALMLVGGQLEEKTRRLFNGSLAIRLVTAGSTNACEQELVALGNADYDVERFGVHFVASPRHADMLMVTGPVSRNMREALVRTYEAVPDPKLVVAVGDDAIDGGIFQGSYAVLDGVHNVIPVDYQIPGDPPSPGRIISSLLAILTDQEARTAQKT